MAQVINTNVPSINAQNNLNKSQSSLTTSLERISSGLRINSAKDDAAGLAIASRMSAQLSGSMQASRNASDGISLAQTAEGSLQSVTDSLQRMRELAVQSSNASNSATDRKAIQNEVDQLVAQINTVSSQASFNGVKLLDGTFTSQTFQVGANFGETISVSSIASAKADSLGVGTNSSYSTTESSTVAAGSISAGGITVNGFGIGPSVSDGVSVNAQLTGAAIAATLALAAGDLLINGFDIGIVAANATDATGQATDGAAAINAVMLANNTGIVATSSGAQITLTASDGRDIVIAGASPTGASGLSAGTLSGGNGSAIAKAAAFNSVAGDTGVNAVATATTRAGTLMTTGASTAVTAGDIKINGISIGAVDAGAADTAAGAVEKGSNVAAAINAISNQTGVKATFSTTDGSVALSAADGRNIKVELGATGNNSGLGATASTATTTYGGLKLTSTSSKGITLGGTNAATAGASMTLGYKAATATFGAGISSVDMTSASGAQSAISTIDAALAQINSSRANLGAIQNRFSAVVSNLATTTENVAAARSRIMDADFAAETASLTRAQILQQAGTAMLAQANSLPQSVLSLLK